MKFIQGLIKFVMEIMETIVFVGSIFMVVYLFILQPNQVKGESMEPTFQSGNYIFTSKVTYKLRNPKRGDVVVFRSPSNPDIEYIKRVIAIPGDTVKIEDAIVYVNDTIVNESYISASTTLSADGYLQNGEEITIQDGYIFVMGDNRPRSSDSRVFGPVPIDSIIGQVFFRYFPADKVGKVINPLDPDLQSLLHEMDWRNYS